MAAVSICIPVYNFPIGPLIAKLSKEISTDAIDAEIVLIDDASDLSFRNINGALTQKYPVNYIQLHENIGRSAIRNLFTKHVTSLLLLFLDCDVMPVSDRFISTYLSAAGKNKIVICGGICYSPKPVADEKKLHWKYGQMRESLPAGMRNKEPYRSFLTGNFLVHKEILDTISFNEQLEGYGYEDTLYGIELERNKIELRHIDLPAEHLKLDTAEEFILKTENALKNLYSIFQSDVYHPGLKRHIKLIRAYGMLKKTGLTIPAYFMYNQFGKKIRRQLTSGNTSLGLLDLYKVLFFISLQKK